MIKHKGHSWETLEDPIYVGKNQVKRVYAGTKQVYPRGSDVRGYIIKVRGWNSIRHTIDVDFGRPSFNDEPIEDLAIGSTGLSIFGGIDREPYLQYLKLYTHYYNNEPIIVPDKPNASRYEQRKYLEELYKQIVNREKENGKFELTYTAEFAYVATYLTVAAGGNDLIDNVEVYDVEDVNFTEPKSKNALLIDFGLVDTYGKFRTNPSMQMGYRSSGNYYTGDSSQTYYGYHDTIYDYRMPLKRGARFIHSKYVPHIFPPLEMIAYIKNVSISVPPSVISAISTGSNNSEPYMRVLEPIEKVVRIPSGKHETHCDKYDELMTGSLDPYPDTAQEDTAEHLGLKTSGDYNAIRLDVRYMDEETNAVKGLPFSLFCIKDKNISTWSGDEIGATWRPIKTRETILTANNPPDVKEVDLYYRASTGSTYLAVAPVNEIMYIGPLKDTTYEKARAKKSELKWG